MAKLKTDGFDDWLGKLRTSANMPAEVWKPVVYDGARVVADAIRAEIEALPVITLADRSKAIRDGRQITGVTQSEKRGLLDGLVVNTITTDSGIVQTHIAFAGYTDHATRKYPAGLPVPMVARATISGTSFRKKDNFIGRAIKKVSEQAVDAMRETAERIAARQIGGEK